MTTKLIVSAVMLFFSQKASAGPFTVDGSAIYESGSNVGIGNATPGSRLVINGANGSTNIDAAFFASGGQMFVEGENDAGNAFKPFTISGSSLTFAINGIAKAIIDPSGNLGIGTTSPSNPLDVAGAAHASSFPTSSDARFKENIKPLGTVIEKIKRLNGVSFDWNEKYKNLGRATKGRQLGVIAQDVEKEFPELVTTWRGPESIIRTKEMITVGPNKGNYRTVEHISKWVDDYRSMDYGRFTAVLLEAVKEQQKEIENQQKQMIDLKTRIAALEKK